MSQEKILLLSKQRAQVMKDKLVSAGAIETNVLTHAKENKAPMFSRESRESMSLNNRADIVVKKLKNKI